MTAALRNRYQNCICLYRRSVNHSVILQNTNLISLFTSIFILQSKAVYFKYAVFSALTLESSSKNTSPIIFLKFKKYSTRFDYAV